MEKFMAIDLGGTNIRCALIDQEYRIIRLVQEKTVHSEVQQDIIGQICSLIQKVNPEKTIQKIGIGVPGVVDEAGTVQYISNISVLEKCPLRRILKEKTGLEVRVLNDCNAAALAEAKIGAGKMYQSVYYVTISTGIGGGFVYRGEVIEGAFGYAGEVGGIFVKETKNKRDTFRGLHPSTAEAIAGGDALMVQGKSLAKKELLHAGEVFMAAKNGEPWALYLVDEMIKSMAMVFADISYVINPEIFVVGGGCMKSAECFWDKMQKEYIRITDKGLHRTKFEKASLTEPGLLGLVI